MKLPVCYPKLYMASRQGQNFVNFILKYISWALNEKKSQNLGKQVICLEEQKSFN